jgi:aspartyl-tRNA synthetase
VVFIDLRDRAGIVQLSFNPEWTSAEVLAAAAALGTESVVLVRGEVALRPNPARDDEMISREVEVRVSELQLVGPAVTPAVPVARVETEELPAEELRLRHRILDLRRPELQSNLTLRHRLLQRARAALCERGFLEIETPILTKPTPEGARDYLVPSRVHPGEFYALPQSPQIYKQLLMVAGFDRYFQIARCFRDEDLRADRQPEFTQIDLEASFVTTEDVLSVVEALMVELWSEAGHSIESPFVRIAHADALERYGTDKPDLRFGIRAEDLSSLVGTDAAPFLRTDLEQGSRLRGIRVPGGAKLSRKSLDGLTELARRGGASGLLWAKRTTTWEGPGAKALGATFGAAFEGKEGDLLLAVHGSDAMTNGAIAEIRCEAAGLSGMTEEHQHAFLWVIDFPLFERDPETGTHRPAHHPFTAPHPEDAPFLEADPARCRALHYDVVYNGNELGSGSIRITDPLVQQRTFRLLGVSEEDIRRRFGFLLDGLSAGAPPHGGFAVGFDRVVMLLAGASSLRDVIAFPKTTAARALFEGAPTSVDAADLAALHLSIRHE